MVFRKSDRVGYGTSAFECYLDICVSEYVCDLAYLWGNVGECFPSPVFVRACVHCGVLFFFVLSAVFVFALLWVGNRFVGRCEELLAILCFVFLS